MVRAVWMAAGFLALGLGIIGIPLPLLPTVPFFLLAAFCFAQSSETLHSWILEHDTFGPPIRDWQSRGAISPRAKVMASLAIAATFLLSVFIGAPGFVLLLQVLVLGTVATFIWTRPA